METRRFGRTGHMSTVAIFGAAAFSQVEQAQADKSMELVLEYGVNHIDVAPSYGDAEARIASWVERYRQRFFLGCKTMERSQKGAATELRRSLERLHTDRFDLYQIHAITSMAELDEATRTGGALDAIQQARQDGLTRYIGITGHGVDSPAVFLEALRRFDFDTVLFPLNFVQYANPVYRKNSEELLKQCRLKDVGVMIIKSITRRPWGDRPHTHTTWYEPLTDAADVQQAVDFALSQDVTGVCTAGDVNALPMHLKACKNFMPMSPREQEALILRVPSETKRYEPLFA